MILEFGIFACAGVINWKKKICDSLYYGAERFGETFGKVNAERGT
jgi:hypothetical protein